MTPMRRRPRGSVVENTDPGAFGEIESGAIGLNLVKTIWQSARLADVDLIAAIVVDVAHSDALAAIDVGAAHDVEYGTPVWNALAKLIAEGWRRPEHMAGCIAKPGLAFGGESGQQ